VRAATIAESDEYTKFKHATKYIYKHGIFQNVKATRGRLRIPVFGESVVGNLVIGVTSFARMKFIHGYPRVVEGNADGRQTGLPTTKNYSFTGIQE
jgi:hypothetical protein